MTSSANEHVSSGHSAETNGKLNSNNPHSRGRDSGGSGSSPSSVKKRASRAGTRSVSTLSAAQLERKRANDREAQRAIRQRTKEHIEKLERRIIELSSGDALNEQLVTALRRTKELEEENARLRSSLDQANFALGGISTSPASWNNQNRPQNEISPTDNSTYSQQAQGSNSQQVSHHGSSSANGSGSAGWDGAQIQQDGFRVGSQQPSQQGMTTPSTTQAPQWRTTNPFSSPTSTRGSSAPFRASEPSGDANSQWGYNSSSRGRAPSNSSNDQMRNVPQPMNYSYILGDPNQPERNRQPSLFHGMPDSHNQRMRHFSETSGLSQMNMNQYGPHNQPSRLYMPSGQQQQQQQPQSGGGRVNPSPTINQSPSHLNPSPINPSPTGHQSQQQQQGMFYGPYSR